MARSCARRSLAAETIFMALVICRVFLTLRMRRRKIEYVCHDLLANAGAVSRQLCLRFCGLLLIFTRGEEVCLVVLDRVGEALLDVVVERLFGGDVGED